jgi:uncharacterized glyoxalase superfamily protein PhnB
MAKPAKKKLKKSAAKKMSKAPARTVAKKKVQAKAKKAAAKTSKSARIVAKSKSKPKAQVKPPSRPAPRKKAVEKIDPLNRKNYTALTVMLAVQDIRSAAEFYQAAFGFTLRGAMDDPDGRMIHAELKMRDTTLMLSPEAAEIRSFSARTIGDTPATLYLLVDNVDDVFGTAVAAGAQVQMPVADMFWGDRCAQIADTEGNKWMIATHKAETTPAQMQQAMKEMMSQASAQAPQEATQSAVAAASDGFTSEY